MPSLDLPGEQAELRELAMRELEALGSKGFRAPDCDEAGDRTNGNRFVVAHHSDRSSAEQQAGRMQARGHKQLYWVEARE